VTGFVNLVSAPRHCVRRFSKDQKNEIPRRAWLFSGALCRPIAALANLEPRPLVDIPLRRLRLPKGGVGRDYVLVPIDIPGEGTQEFMLDSGLTTEMITPVLKKRLGLASIGLVEGTTGAGTRDYNVVEIKGASVEGVTVPTLHATISDFPQEHMDPQHDVTGMLGLELMDAFDVDIDFVRKRLRFWRRGDGTDVARSAEMAEIPAARLPSGTVAVRVAGREGFNQPFAGIVDCGSSFSILSVEAAKLSGVDTSHLSSVNAPKLIAVGVDGKPFPLPLISVPLRLMGGLDKQSGQFENSAPVSTIPVGVGDLPAFLDLLDGRSKAAALIGIDFWSQGRVIFIGGDEGSRKRSIYWKQG